MPTMVSKISRRRWSRDNYQFAFVAPALDLISLLRGLTTAGNETNALCILLVRYMRGLGQTEVPLHLCSTTMRCRARILEKVNVLHYTPLWRVLQSLIILMKNHNVSMSKQSASYLVSNHCFMVNGMYLYVFLGSSVGGNNKFIESRWQVCKHFSSIPRLYPSCCW